MYFFGKIISGVDVFKKMVDAGFAVLTNSVSLLSMVADYFIYVSKLKISDVMRLNFDEHGEPNLEKQSTL